MTIKANVKPIAIADRQDAIAPPAETAAPVAEDADAEKPVRKTTYDQVACEHRHAAEPAMRSNWLGAIVDAIREALAPPARAYKDIASIVGDDAALVAEAVEFYGEAMSALAGYHAAGAEAAGKGAARDLNQALNHRAIAAHRGSIAARCLTIAKLLEATNFAKPDIATIVGDDAALVAEAVAYFGEAMYILASYDLVAADSDDSPDTTAVLFPVRHRHHQRKAARCEDIVGKLVEVMRGNSDAAAAMRRTMTPGGQRALANAPRTGDGG